MSDADGDLTSCQEGGKDDEDDVPQGSHVRGSVSGRPPEPEQELESLQSGVSSDVEEGVNVEQKIKRFGKENKKKTSDMTNILMEF